MAVSHGVEPPDRTKTVITTPRLRIDQVDPDDIPLLLDVRLSNPERLRRTEGSGGEAGHYDQDMLERDVVVAGMDPARLLLTCRLTHPDGALDVIGMVDLITEHPDDGHPWLGVVEIHRDVQRRGYGYEAASAAIGHLVSTGSGAAIRCAVDTDDAVGRAFATRCGFAPTGGRDGRLWELPR